MVPKRQQSPLRKRSSPGLLNANAIKFLIGTLTGAAMMTLVDMNDMFQGLTTDFSSNNLRSQSLALQDQYYLKMSEDPRLAKSELQQASFVKARNYVSALFDRPLRFDTDQGDYAVTAISEQWAFLHVWVNGDRTVIKVAEDQLNESQHRRDHSHIRKRKWMALVQDPLQHFLEGWAITEMKLVENAKEDGHEDLAQKIIESWENEHLTYDQRVAQFLERVQRFSLRKATAEISPLMHALPQSNFFLNDVGMVDSQLVVIGDMSEWQAMMELAGFTGNPEDTDIDLPSTLQTKYFPADPSLLSDETLLKLCGFLAMDYFLLRYEPPSVCMKKNGPLDFNQRLSALQEGADNA